MQNIDIPSMFWMGTGFTWIFTLLFAVFLILGIIALGKWILSPDSSGGRIIHKTALEILKERYVKGEIDKKEFDSKKKDLS